jgi:hypothetical protein
MPSPTSGGQIEWNPQAGSQNLGRAVMERQAILNRVRALATTALGPAVELIHHPAIYDPPREGWQVRCSVHGLLGDGHAYARIGSARMVASRHRRRDTDSAAARLAHDILTALNDPDPLGR